MATANTTASGVMVDANGMIRALDNRARALADIQWAVRAMRKASLTNPAQVRQLAQLVTDRAFAYQINGYGSSTEALAIVAKAEGIDLGQMMALAQAGPVAQTIMGSVAPSLQADGSQAPATSSTTALMGGKAGGLLLIGGLVVVLIIATRSS